VFQRGWSSIEGDNDKMIRITLQERVSLPTVYLILIFRLVPYTLPMKMKESPGTYYAEKNFSLVE